MRPLVTVGRHGASVLGEWARAAGGPAGGATARDPIAPYVAASKRLSPSSHTTHAADSLLRPAEHARRSK